MKKLEKGKPENQQETTKVNTNFKKYRKKVTKTRETTNSKEKKKRTGEKKIKPPKFLLKTQLK